MCKVIKIITLVFVKTQTKTQQFSTRKAGGASACKKSITCKVNHRPLCNVIILCKYYLLTKPIGPILKMTRKGSAVLIVWRCACMSKYNIHDQCYNSMSIFIFSGIVEIPFTQVVQNMSDELGAINNEP